MAAAEEQTRLQIGHVLFIDIVGYSKLLGNQQSELLRELNEVVSGTNEFREAETEGKATEQVAKIEFKVTLPQ